MLHFFGAIYTNIGFTIYKNNNNNNQKEFKILFCCLSVMQINLKANKESAQKERRKERKDTAEKDANFGQSGSN